MSYASIPPQCVCSSEHVPVSGDFALCSLGGMSNRRSPSIGCSCRRGPSDASGQARGNEQGRGRMAAEKAHTGGRIGRHSQGHMYTHVTMVSQTTYIDRTSCVELLEKGSESDPLPRVSSASTFLALFVRCPLIGPSPAPSVCDHVIRPRRLPTPVSSLAASHPSRSLNLPPPPHDRNPLLFLLLDPRRVRSRLSETWTAWSSSPTTANTPSEQGAEAGVSLVVIEDERVRVWGWITKRRPAEWARGRASGRLAAHDEWERKSGRDVSGNEAGLTGSDAGRGGFGRSRGEDRSSSPLVAQTSFSLV
jgi:hypothetical protein